MMATSPMESLSSGFIINIELFFITLLLALPLGLVITFCSMSKFKPLKWLSRTFVWIIRGTPLMLQLFVVLYAPGLLFSMPMSNEVITLTKDTALARIIGLAEIIMCAERFTKQGLIWPLFSTAVFFLVFNGILTLLFGWIEKKMDYFRV